MRKIGITLLLLTVILGACKKTDRHTDIPESPRWSFEQLKIEKELFPTQDSTTDKGMDLALEFNYPSHFQNDSILPALQASFVTAFAGEEYKNKTPQQAFEDYEKAVEDDFMKMGSYAIGDGPDISTYFKNIATTVHDTTDITVTARTEVTDYTGGAHGSRNIFYYNIDTRTGKIFSEKEFFKANSQGKLTELLEEKVKTTKNQNGDDVTLLEPEQVVPNGNFYFGDEGVVYVYNQYEIAPYSDGLIEITLPYDEIRTLINPLFELIIELNSDSKTE